MGSQYGLARNTIAHAHTAAALAYSYSGTSTRLSGLLKEVVTYDPDQARDTYKDLFNNEIGIKIGEHVYKNLGLTGAAADEAIDDLIIDAYNRGDLIVDPNSDPRVFGMAPVWYGPSSNWQSASAGRDYTGTNSVESIEMQLAQTRLGEAIGGWVNSATNWANGIQYATITNSVSLVISDILSLFNLAETRGSPLVLDLDGDGIELTSLSGTGAVYWDINADGFREASGWVTGGDGLLAIDKNGDGIINNNGELFGNSANVANGFDALAAYDSNVDGFITALDTAFLMLKVWVDVNGNGYSEGAELHTLTALGITSITTTYTDTALNNNGNMIEETSTFVQNGTTKSIVDAWFAYDTVNTVYNGDYTLDVRTLFMPTLRGYGTIADLHIAMSLSNTGAGNLLDKVAALQSKTFAQMFDSTSTLRDDVRAILFKWAGVDGVANDNVKIVERFSARWMDQRVAA